MAEVADAFVTLIPSFKGGQAAIARQFDGPASAAGKSSGSKLSGALNGVLKKSALSIGVAAGGILGTALFKGFQRLSAIDEAKAKLSGLGNSAGTVSKIMDNALTSVKGTAFGLGDAATVAAGAVASGIKPGKELEKTLRLVADSATIGGTSLGEMGAIFNKVAASGKIQGDVIAQLGDRGIPILQLLGKQIGKTPAEVSKLASQGKIDFKTFSAAMQDGLGGAALKSGKTFKGAFANMNAALGRLGAGLLTGVFPIAKSVFGSITGFLDTLTPKVGAFADKFAGKLPGAFAAIGKAVSGIDFGAIAGKLAPLISAFQSFASDVGSAGKKLGPALLSIAKGLAPIAKAAIVVGITNIVIQLRLLGPIIDGLATGFAAVTDFVKSNQTGFKIVAGILTAALIPAFVLMGVQATTAAAAAAAAFITTKIQAISSIAFQVAGLTLIALGWASVGVAALAGAVVVAAAWLLSIAPIALAIAAVAGAAFLIIKYWGQIKSFVTGAVSAVVNFIKAHWPLILAILTGPIGLAVLAIVKNFDKIKAAGTTLVGWVRAIPGKLGALASKFGSAGKDLIGAFINGLTKAGSFATNFASSIWNAVKGAINSGIDKLNGLLDFSIKIGPKTFHLSAPNIGHLARGTDYWRGGPTMVGENGPEILNLPRGAQVTPNHKLDSALGSKGLSNVQNIYQQPGQSAQDLANMSADRLLFALAGS